ncbi:MAG: hypothetical protein IKX48_06560, partial [Victivallales bacterium]|nr:hypothetical protein [Victivallales bacterium]
IVAGYREVNRLVVRLSEPPSVLTERIISACHTPGRRESIRPFPWWRRTEIWPRVATAAAASAAILLAGGILMTRLSESSGGEGTIAAAPLVVEQPQVTVAEDNIAPEATSMMIALNESEPPIHDEPLAVRHGEELKLNGGVSTQDLRAVSRNGGGYAKNGRAIRTYQLQDNIRHVWNIDNFDLSLAELHRLDASGKYQMELDESDPNSVRALFLGISDRELQELVDRFSGMKWALVSPFLPQPNESKQVEFTGKKVNYLLVGVRK